MNTTVTDKPTITKAQAQSLDREIRNSLDAMEILSKETWEQISSMRNTLGYKHLGFDDFELYMTNRTEQYHLLKASRGNLVIAFAQVGYNQKEIAEKLNVSRDTVQRDLAQGAENRHVNLPAEVQRRDGKSQKRTITQPPRQKRESEQPQPMPPHPETRSKPRHAFWECTPDGWRGAFKTIKDAGRALTENPTYEQLEELEDWVITLAAKVRRMKKEIEEKRK